MKADPKTEKFRGMLLSQKQKLLNSSAMASREDLEVSSDDLSDEGDLANSIISQSVSTNIRDKEVQDLQRIEEALERLAEGSYFECDECGDKIEEKRLLALPTSKYCIACAEIHEKKRKQYA